MTWLSVVLGTAAHRKLVHALTLINSDYGVSMVLGPIGSSSSPQALDSMALQYKAISSYFVHAEYVHDNLILVYDVYSAFRQMHSQMVSNNAASGLHALKLCMQSGDRFQWEGIGTF